MNLEQPIPIPATIIESPLFTRLWSAMKLSVDDLLAMQNVMLKNVRRSPPISNCGCARKMRFAPPSLDKGKSGSIRVIFKYFEAKHRIFVALAYPKGTKEDITAAEKKIIREMIKEFEQTI